MREKAIERRTVNKEHNSNFKAGYVPIEEERLHKTGLRGRKGIIAIAIIILLFLLALINLIVSLLIWIYYDVLNHGIDYVHILFQLKSCLFHTVTLSHYYPLWCNDQESIVSVT